jgi:Asp-tRNA(Asn)/Glu-tRNA(Gln) amidotransferase C subunit
MAAIPDSVAALADASREALSEAVTEPVQDQLAEIAGSAQRAMAVARQASERLTRQLLVMSETAAAIEDRIAEDRAQREEKEAENLTRRVSLLIEALNSTAIDVNKLLSNEVDDSAWAAYLKGDRGVFTRRAVRLLDSGEAREIVRHYEEEPDFRDQVNRYIHDFEAMLRRVLTDREGTTLGVTLLSSDMGKLYVALSQAVERTRR